MSILPSKFASINSRLELPPVFSKFIAGAKDIKPKLDVFLKKETDDEPDVTMSNCPSPSISATLTDQHC